MSQPRRILLLAIAAMLLAVVGWHLYATREPSYQGKRLTEWLLAGANDGKFAPASTKQSREAIRAIGTNGLPTLIRLIQVKDSAVKRTLMSWAEKQSLVEFHFQPAWTRQGYAVEGFLTLGPEGKEAIPALAKLLQDTDLAGNAAVCLAAIGPEAVPILRHELGSTNALIRYACLGALDYLGTNAMLFFPAIMQSLQDPDPHVRFAAVHCLRQFPNEAKMVLPVLLKVAQQDSYRFARTGSLSVMGSFSNQAAAFAPALRQMLADCKADEILLRPALVGALRKIDPTGWPNDEAMPPANRPKSLSPVGPAFQPAGPGGFLAPSSFDGQESPSNRQPGKAALQNPAEGPGHLDRP